MNAMDWRQPAYLKQSVKMELLACRWYVWPHLISPAQHALNLLYRYLPILRSFVRSPSVHEAATRDPNLFWGPFINLPVAHVAQISALIRDIEARCGKLLAFAEHWRKFDKRLQECATGASLDELYTQLPDSLTGTIEIGYDTNNRATIRLLEEMLYDGALENSHTQELSLFCAKDRERKFFLNTPRPPSLDRLDLRVPFSDPRIDMISAMRIRPVTPAAVADEFRMEQAEAERFSHFVTVERPRRNAPAYAGQGVRLRYFGHACVLVQTASTSILFDPVVAWDRDEEGATLTFDDLPDFIDHVVLTHNHQDHFCPEVLLQLRTRIGRVLVPRSNPSNVADPSMKLALRHLGLDAVDALDPLSRICVASGALTTIPFFGEHAGLDVYSKQGALVELEGYRMLFLADSDCCDRNLYRRLARRLGRVDALFIGMECHGAPLSWLYGPYLTRAVGRGADESRRLSGSDCERAWAVIEELGCQRVFIYAMGQEPWLRHLLGLAYAPDSIQIVESDRLLARCRDHGIPAERLNGCCEIQL